MSTVALNSNLTEKLPLTKANKQHPSLIVHLIKIVLFNLPETKNSLPFVSASWLRWTLQPCGSSESLTRIPQWHISCAMAWARSSSSDRNCATNCWKETWKHLSTNEQTAYLLFSYLKIISMLVTTTLLFVLFSFLLIRHRFSETLGKNFDQIGKVHLGEL